MVSPLIRPEHPERNARHLSPIAALVDGAGFKIHEGFLYLPSLRRPLSPLVQVGDGSSQGVRIGAPLNFFRFYPPSLRPGQVAYRIHRFAHKPSTFELSGYEERLCGILSPSNNDSFSAPVLGAVDPRVDRGVVIQWFELPDPKIRLHFRQENSEERFGLLFADAFLFRHPPSG